MIGDFKNGGREWRPRGDPEEVRVYDFVDPKQGKAMPYGVYDVTQNEAFVNVGCDHIHTDEMLDNACFVHDDFHGEWNYVVST